MDLVIYGAQGIALGTYNAIKEIHPDWKIICFLVTAMEGNAPTLGGIPVRELAEFLSSLSPDDKKALKVLIGTPESVMGAIEKSLQEEEFTNYERIDSVRWAQLQEQAFSKNKKFIPLSDFAIGDTKVDIEVYMAKFYKDKEISSKDTVPNYLIPIQVGAANTDVRVADIVDCEGDNISVNNGNYSELTALYWMWKHKADFGKYYGLAHYRRYLMLSDDDLTRLDANSIDAVLPYPMPYEPNIEAHREIYLSNEEWTAVLQALDELQPEYATAFKDVLKQSNLYNYNIMIVKSKVLDDYCNWLFPLLFRIEEINDPEGIKEPNRYIGYVGETLETLYFMYNKDNLKIAHAGCRFLV